MPTLKINMPDEDFEKLINNYETYKIMTEGHFDLDYLLAIIVFEIKTNLKFFKKINFNEVYPGYNFDEILPQLQIGEDGYAKFDVEEVFAGYDYDPEHYLEINVENKEVLYYMVYESNKNFDLMGILGTTNNLKMAVDEDEYFKIFQNINLESWEIDQIYKYINRTNNMLDLNVMDLLNFKTKNATMTFEING